MKAKEVWCNCGDQIMPDDDAQCGVCAMTLRHSFDDLQEKYDRLLAIVHGFHADPDRGALCRLWQFWDDLIDAKFLEGKPFRDLTPEGLRKEAGLAPPEAPVPAAWQKCTKRPVTIEFREAVPGEVITTIEGTRITMTPGHLVMRGTRGEIYPITRAIFQETYTRVEKGHETRGIEEPGSPPGPTNGHGDG